MKFKVGDLVQISPNLASFDPDEFPGIVPYMLKYAGEIDVVEHITPVGNVQLANNSFNWNPKWLEPYEEISPIDLDEIL